MQIGAWFRSSVAAAVSLAVVVTCAAPGRSAPAPQSLKDDGRVGVVTDLQGTALVRPSGRERWSPVGQRTVLLPGDELRTMTRGAHAAEVRLAGGGSLVLGPGALAQIERKGVVHLRTGDAEVAGADGRPVTVTGPGSFTASVEATAGVFRTDGRATSKLDAPPRWLTGYRGSTTDEWMGSLVANVDGRDVALTVGYHKVSVVIRDQIAETTVEESFVNSTHTTLEGTFTFPLPADASISGFGMWIGDEYVAADIVEKQRARAIYEDIKRRRKDPGLLEWSGGNLFRASVFPIPGGGEKRIKVRYTQVLPLEGTTFRYRYALRSEMLRTTPLRQLAVHLDVESAAPLRSVSSPTHDVRLSQSEHTATLDFDASDFTPDRDFEAVFGLDASAPLRAIAHRRGEDGYLMLLLAPPDAEASEWKRDLVPEGDPLDVLFVADTSGSMGPAEREAQRAFVETTLALLGAKDRFRLMACDAKPVWLVGDAQPATEDNAAKALALLQRRISLGWTDLDGALAEALSKAGPGTLVAYVGDGIGTTGDVDPVALAQRIRRLAPPQGATLHAIAAGSAYEQGVLEAMASHGGAVRSTGSDPAEVARRFLSEVAQPAVKNLAVSFEGIRTAKVYPGNLPNLPAGTQQIVLGRFLPEGDGEQRARVTVTGTLAGKPVQYSADLVVAPGAEGTGNSFLPRLWARRHLDALLSEGRSPAVQEEIVSFSERFGIITPYTSFLVLESDADREMYGVERRVQMRDGERFFTEGRTAAATEALREQMRNAQTWRMNLQRRMRAEIARLGRDIDLVGGYAYGIPGAVSGVYQGLLGETRTAYYGRGGGGAGGGDRVYETQGLGGPSTGGGASAWEFARREGFEDSKLGELDMEMPPGDEMDAAKDGDFLDDMDEGSGPDSREPGDPPPAPEEASVAYAKSPAPAAKPRAASEAFYGMDGDGRRSLRSADYRGRAENLFRGPGGGKALRDQRGQTWLSGRLYERFPYLPAAPALPPLPETKWSPDVAAWLESVSSTPRPTAPLRVRTRSGGLTDDPDLPWPDLDATGVLSAERWVADASTRDGEPGVQWSLDDRGIVALGTLLGRRRPRADADRDGWAQPLGLTRPDYRRAYVKWSARAVSQDGDTAVVELTAPAPSKARVVVTIDLAKRVVLRVESFNEGKRISGWTASGHTQIGGVWWPATIVSTDADDKETWRQTVDVREISAAAADAAFADLRTRTAPALLLRADVPAILDAKQADHDGRATFDDLLAICADHCAFQRWDDAWAVWARARTLAGDKPGLSWIEPSLLAMSRSGEPFLAHLRRLADSVVASPGPAAFPLATYVAAWSDQGPGVEERLALVDVLSKAGSADDDPATKRRRAGFWAVRRAQVLQSGGRWAEAIEIWRARWNERPSDPHRIHALMNAFVATGDVDGALELFRALDLSKPRPAERWIVQNVFQQLANLLWNANRFDLLLETSTRWSEIQPDASEPWQDRLAALVALGRDADYDTWLAAHLVVTDEDAADAAAKAQLDAAVRVVLGQDRWGWRWGRPTDARWDAALAVIARRAVQDERMDIGLASMIVQHARWRTTDAHRDLVAQIRADVSAPQAIETLPAQRLAQVLSWLAWDRNSVDAPVWRGVVDRMRARLVATEDDATRATLLVSVLNLLDQHAETDEAVAVLRAEVAAATDAKRAAGLVPELLRRLMALPWTQALEDEAFALVPRLAIERTDPNQPDPERAVAWTVRALVDDLLRGRIDAALPPPVEREKLSRAELKSRTADARTDARRALAAHLDALAKDASAVVRPWYEIERLCLAAQLAEDFPALEGEAREMLLSIAAPPTSDGVPRDDTGAAPVAPDDSLRWVLRERSVLVLSYASVHRTAPEGLADRVEELLRDRLAKDEEEEALDWRYALFRLEAALDRPERLEEMLREWIRPEKVESRWRVALAWLLAETGRMADAAAQFEEVAKLGELGERDYVALASWYLVAGEDARRESALDRRYSVVDEWQLAQRIWQEASRVGSPGPDGVPPRMDDEILRAIRVLFGKTTNPDHAVNSVRTLYRQTKDFRLLASLPDGVIGHTPESVYAFLGASQQLVGEVHEEATCDEMRDTLEKRLPDAKTDTDRRGLRLLKVLVERRAAEVLDQRGPHAGRALAELQTAWKGEWAKGERRLLAEFLARMGKIPDAALAAEQVKQLRELHGMESPGTVDRLRVADALWRTEWGYGRGEPALDGIVAALDEYRPAAGGRLPRDVDDLADRVADWSEALKRFGFGETWLDAETARQQEKDQVEWYVRRTFQLYVAAMRGRGTLSFGGGADLYRGARERISKALFGHTAGNLGQVVRSYCDLHRAAHKDAKLPGVGDDLVDFSRTTLVEALPRFQYDANQQVLVVSDAIDDVAGPLAALTLLVERMESEPDRPAIRSRGADAWQTFGWRMAHRRREAKGLGALEPRLLKVVLREEERDLTSEESHGRALYGNHNSSDFWSEKRDDFLAVARRVVELNPQAPGRLRHTAEYLWGDLGANDEAIRVLEEADRRGALREDGRWNLVQWHQELKHWAESLPHAARLVAERPDNLEYRMANVRALHGVARDDEGRKLVTDTQEKFEDPALRRAAGGQVAARLADLCLECEYADLAVPLYEQALNEHRRVRRVDRGQGDSEASRLYAGKARALASLSRFDEAVDASAAAVVAWGRNEGYRANALQSLRDVLGKIPDLPAWTERWEKQVAESGLDAPVIRRALADLHLKRKEPDAALRHLLVAREQTPDDLGIHEAVIRACEMKKDQEALCAALAASLERLPRRPDAYVQLAAGLRKLGRADDAERALTGLAEYAPNEPEGHDRLAKAFDEAKRPDDAAVQWRQVVRVKTADPAGWFGLARSLAAAGRRDEAVGVLDEMLRQPFGPDQAKAIVDLRREWGVR